jgi:phosphoribosylglycinamide formyltransferase 2
MPPPPKITNTIGTPLQPGSTKLLLLGSGELGKEVAIEAMRLGVEVIACDRYADAPAMQIAHRSHVLDMLDAAALRSVIELEQPTYIVPELEAIATDELEKLEDEGFTVIPTAKAARLTMDREGIRRLAAEELGLRTAAYRFADSEEELLRVSNELGYPCVVKPVMSSSGKGQTVVHDANEIAAAWRSAQEAKRGRQIRVIVESFIKFHTEITLLTLRTANGTLFCPPIGHLQKEGDYMESWQPQAVSERVLTQAQDVARKVTDALGGRGIYGVELFLTEDGVVFSEVSPRPHDTGMVTMITQNLSEFALHVRALLGLPVPLIRLVGTGASAAVRAHQEGQAPTYRGMAEAMSEKDTQVRIFGKPSMMPKRRMAVALALDETVEAARAKARRAASAIQMSLTPGTNF